MDKLKELLDKYINERLKKAVISNARKKDGISKLQVRPNFVKRGACLSGDQNRRPKGAS